MLGKDYLGNTGKPLQTAEGQSSVWVGGALKGDIPVADPRNKTALYNQRIARTAEILDIPEEEVKVRWINGDIKFYSILAAAMAAGAFKDIDKKLKPNTL